MAQYLDALELFEKNCMTEYLAIKVSNFKTHGAFNSDGSRAMWLMGHLDDLFLKALLLPAIILI